LEAFTGVEGGKTIWFQPLHDNVIMRFLHLDSFEVKRGDRVVEGQQIAVTGNTGKLSRGPHLHLDVSRGAFKLAWPGNFIDPLTYDWEWKPEPAPVPPVQVPTTFWVTVTATKLNVRVQPTTTSSLVPEKQLKRGDRVEIAEGVQGQAVEGNTQWLRTKKSSLYIWSGGTDFQP
jgi:hypothetical protein